MHFVDFFLATDACAVSHRKIICVKRTHIIAASDPFAMELGGLIEFSFWQGILGSIVLLESLDAFICYQLGKAAMGLAPPCASCSRCGG